MGDFYRFNSAIARNIRFLREERGLSTDDLATISKGISKSLIIKIEHNAKEKVHKNFIDKRHIELLAKALEVPIDIITETNFEINSLFEKVSNVPILANSDTTLRHSEYMNATNELVLRCAFRGPLEQAMALLIIGEYDYNRGEVGFAQKALEHALELAEIADDETVKRRVCHFLANCHFLFGRFDLVHELLESPNQIEPGECERNSKILLLRGMAYSRQSNWMLSEEYYKRALSEAKASPGFKVMEGRCMQALGDLYKAIQRYDEAILISEDAVRISLAAKDNISAIYAFKTIAEVFNEQNNTDQAVLHYKQALELAEEIESFRKVDKLKIGFLITKCNLDLRGMVKVYEELEGCEVPKSELSATCTDIARLAFAQNYTEIAQRFYEKAIQMLQ